MAYDTKLLDDSPESIEYASKLINAGEVVGIPTETVYGLAADAFNEGAVRRIFEAKERPADNPLIVHISELSMISETASEIPAAAISCAKAFWPGPLTLVLPKTPDIPLVTSGGLDTVGIRMPSHPAARALIDAAGVPLAAPSANLSGRPSPTTAAHVLHDMKGRIPAIIDGGACEAGVESTVVCFEQNAVKILRPGRITAEMLSQVVPDVRIDKGVLHALDENARAASPGMKYKHYSPAAEVYAVSGTAKQFSKFAEEFAAKNPGTLLLVFSPTDAPPRTEYIAIGQDPAEQAKNLFSALRKADELNVKTILARCPKTEGVGLAVYNRLIRAAGFKEIKL